MTLDPYAAFAPSRYYTGFAVTDGEDFVLWDYPHARTFETRSLAEYAATQVCYHPHRMAGAPRVEQVTIEVTKHGTVLSVKRIPA